MAVEWTGWDGGDDDEAFDGDAFGGGGWSPAGEEGEDGIDVPATTPDGPLAGRGFDWDAILFHEEFDPPTRDAPIEHPVSLGVLEPVLQHVLASLRREHRGMARRYADDALECAFAQQLVERRMRAVADLLAWARAQRGGRCVIGLYPADAATTRDLHAARRQREAAAASGEFLAFLDEGRRDESPWTDDAQWAGEPEAPGDEEPGGDDGAG